MTYINMGHRALKKEEIDEILIRGQRAMTKEEIEEHFKKNAYKLVPIIEETDEQY